ncbi:ethanolamine utilization phosphate acetyltransferase EutD [Clostridium gasigenes]|uniref:Phosphate propanoyltransferase n=1 Tax=Clostridium gasigenes TaxID=94869 RepID=A0A1H0VAQ0_9CLOT|nr:ethanolamine utilization phosphate acetyltransferase EutD [Clostridium gasigenes]MBB6624360.1 phosphate propanoyltransferase [Clostridium gasigenes]MBU3088745.1 phosphate propanoyltransferase [Clostridium gasigenes]MBU3136106.1 phosphate propanoyltransferase [Clostridium gasigenes]SDP75612.1 Propanediol utilization protein [Clostridium gasigenes]
MDDKLIDNLVEQVLSKVKEEIFIGVEASGRHVHLSRECIDILFGKGYELTKVKELSQPGQFACKERVTLIGPKGSMANVVVLGPERKDTQVEISATDALILGLKVPVRESGDVKGSSGILIVGEKSAVKLEEGTIIAKRHIHLTPKDAKKFKVNDKENVKVQVLGSRKLIFDDVAIRVSEHFNSKMHIDYDEANACGFKNGILARIIK